MKPSDILFWFEDTDGDECVIMVPKWHWEETNSLYDQQLSYEVDNFPDFLEEVEDSTFVSSLSNEKTKKKLMSLGFTYSPPGEEDDFHTTSFVDDFQDEDDEDSSDFQDEDDEDMDGLEMGELNEEDEEDY